jgi:uncharacterized membrane protein
MNVDLELILLKGVTLAVVVFGAFVLFMVRRWFSPSRKRRRRGFGLLCCYSDSACSP